MEWLHSFTVVDFAVVGVILLGLCVVHLFARVKGLESYIEKEFKRQINKLSKDLVEVANRLAVSFLRPNNDIKADDTHGALNLIEHDVDDRLFYQIPGLRRVVSFSIGVSFDYYARKPESL